MVSKNMAGKASKGAALAKNKKQSGAGLPGAATPVDQDHDAAEISSNPEPDVVAKPSPTSKEAPPVASKKKAKTPRPAEDFSLQALDRDARRQAWARIRDRLKAAFFVTAVADIAGGVKSLATGTGDGVAAGGAGKGGNKQAKTKSAGERIADVQAFVASNLMTVVSLICIFMLFYMKASQEGYQGGEDDDGINPYEALGVSSSASQSEIKKVYKKLALQWHPDKHDKDCESCAKRFHEITVAFGKIGEEDKRNAYDSNRSARRDVLTNSNSLQITPEVWKNEVTKSNDPWLILFYDGEDDSKGIFPMFEEMSLKHGNYVRYAHCDATSPDGEKVMALFPARFVVYPVVVRYAYGEHPEVWSQPRDRDLTEGMAIRSIRKFVYETYPVSRLPYVDAGGIGEYLEEAKKDVLFVTPSRQVIPSNTRLRKPHPEQWKGFTQKNPFDELALKLMPVENVLLLYKYALRYGGKRGLKIGITSHEDLMEYFNSKMNGKDGTPDANELELAKQAYLYFHLQQGQWQSKWQDLPFLALAASKDPKSASGASSGPSFRLAPIPMKSWSQSPELLKKWILSGNRDKYASFFPSRAKYLKKHAGGFPATTPGSSPLVALNYPLRSATHRTLLRKWYRPYLAAHELWRPEFASCFDIYEAADYTLFLKNEADLGEDRGVDEPDMSLVRDAGSPAETSCPVVAVPAGGKHPPSVVRVVKEDPSRAMSVLSAAQMEEFKVLMADAPDKAQGHLLETFLRDVANQKILPVDQTSWPHLCKVGPNFARTKNYCLFIEADKLAKEGGAEAVLKKLHNGQEAYKKELKHEDGDEDSAAAGKENGEGAGEGEFKLRVQPVVYQAADVLGTAPLWPVSPAFLGPGVLSRPELQNSDYLLVDAQTKSVQAVRSKQLKLEDLHTGLGFDDIQFLADDFPDLRPLLSTDRVTLAQEVASVLFGSWPRIAFTYFVVVLVLSFLPESRILLLQNSAAGPGGSKKGGKGGGGKGGGSSGNALQNLLPGLVVFFSCAFLMGISYSARKAAFATLLGHRSP